MAIMVSSIFNSVVAWPWLKFSPLILAFVITLCEALTRGPTHRWFYKFLLPLLSAAALIASCLIVWSDDKSAREARTGESLHLDRIEGKLGVEEATKRYLDAVGNLTRQLTAAKTGNSVEKFFSSEAERRKLRDEVNQANQKLLLADKIRMNPVHDYILSKVDTWLSELEKRGIKVRLSKSDFPAVQIGVQVGGVARSAVFGTGDTMQLEFYSAIINDGHLTGSFLSRIYLNSNRGNGNALVFQMYFYEDGSYRILETRPRFSYKPYTGHSDNPIEDKEFIASLDDALDEAMAFVVEEATALK